MEAMVNAPRRGAGSAQQLQKFLGQDIIVPAKTVGLSDSEKSLPGKVVDVNPEDSSLWCTVSGDKRWYRWHVEDVRSWLLAPGKRSVRPSSMPALSKDNPTSRALPQSPPGKSQRPQLAGSKPRPQAPGPEQLWKYCKRCNSWKERPGDFSKNHRTPDGLQFYCRYCHNRMTKFNQQRRLEDRHIAEKHHVVKSPRKGPPAKITLARASHASSTSHSPSSHSRGSPAFDVISSKIPRQQRTHAIYRRDSDPTSSAGPSPHRQPPLKSPSPNRDSTAGQQAKAQRSLGSDNGICNQGSLDSAKQQVQQLFKPKPRRSPSAHSQARASAELMLQANAVLQELDHSLLQAAEAASAEVAAAAARSASQHDSTAVPRRPVSPSPQANSPPSPLVPRVASSASPRVHVQSQQQKSGRLELGSGFPPGPSPQPLQHRSFSMPAQQVTHPPSSIHTLSHSLAQLRQACVVDRDDTDNNRDKQEQQQQPEQLAQRLTTQSPPLLTKAEPPAAQPGLAAEHAMPDAASEPVSDAHEPASDAHEPVNDAREPVSDAHEPGQRRCHADRSKGLASPERSGSGISPMLQGRSVQGPCGNQSCLPDLAMASLEEPGLKAPMAQADTDSMDIDHRSGSLSKDSLQGVALLSVLHPSHQNAKAEHASKALQPAVSETAALAKALSEASGRSSARAASSPPAPMQGAAPDVLSAPPAAPTPLELDPTSSPEPTEPSLKKRKIPRVAAPSDLAGAVKSGSPSLDGDAVAVGGSARQHSSGVELASHKANACTTADQPPELAPAAAACEQDTNPTTVPLPSLPIARSSLPLGDLPLPSGGGPLSAAAALAPLDSLGSIINALSLCTSPQQLQGFFLDLQAQGNCQQVLKELEKHFRHAGQNPSSLYTSVPPWLSAARPPSMPTTAEARPQLHPISGLAPSGGNSSKLRCFGASSSLPLPKKPARKRTRPESSNASLEAAINSLRSDTTPSHSPSPSAFSDSQFFPPSVFPPTGFTASMPVAAFGSSAMRLALLAGAGAQGTPRTGLAFGTLATSFGPGPAAASSAAGAPGPSGGTALELSLLLTTLQSLAQLPGEPGQPINLIASSSQVAEAQLREWLRQLQQHAASAPGEVSAAQQSQEDGAIAAQVRQEMWGNLQSILAMLAGQGCSPHVQDMVHQIAVHFANEQSQSVALERRMTCNLSREKEAQKHLQQQLRSGIQVLSSLQKVLGAVRMQQQRAKSLVDQSASGMASESHSISQLRLRVVQAESAEATAQQAVRALQKKEVAWEAELGAAQTSNAQLHTQVAELLQEKAVLQNQNAQHAKRLQSLQAEEDAVSTQLTEDKTRPKEQLNDIQPSHTEILSE